MDIDRAKGNDGNVQNFSTLQNSLEEVCVRASSWCVSGFISRKEAEVGIFQ